MNSAAAGRVFGRHSGFRNLKAYQVAELLYDYTCRFCARYVPPGDRHYDQMVQAARSGYQNIAEGSEDSATSKKLEMNLTNVARSVYAFFISSSRRWATSWSRRAWMTSPRSPSAMRSRL
jgi:hypothetical protein